MRLALVLWLLSAVCALLAIPAPNGFPLLIVAVVFYGLAWRAYNPKENR